jgi:hypothetical protein
MLRSFKSQLIIMQSQFAIISEARTRVGDLLQQVDACMGDNLATVSNGSIHEEDVFKPDSSGYDPSQPGSPFVDVERPPAASPYY